MATRPSHEEPLLVILPPGTSAGEELAAFAASPAVASFHLPPPWAFESIGLAADTWLAGARTCSLEALPDHLARLTACCDDTMRESMVRQGWLTAPESVRDFYLGRGAFKTFAAIFKMAPSTRSEAPPEVFRKELALQHGFAVEYRLPAEGDDVHRSAPAEEASLVYYPFDPKGEGRDELKTRTGGVVLEAFAYAEGRAQHAKVLTDFGAARGWQVVDPASTDDGAS